MHTEIRVRQIWQVTTENFLTSGKEVSGEGKVKRPTKIMNDEFIEIRYPYDWHFRTVDDQYYHATPEMIYQNCKYIGDIHEEVRFKNKANLEEILRLELYK